VVLPAPFGPMMPRISPRRTSSDTSFTATRPPKDFVRLRTSSTFGGAPIVSTDWRRENAEQGLMFASYLTDETFAQGGSILEVLECAAEAKKIAHIGGGCGALLTPLLIGFPHLTGVLFETPHMIETAKPFLQVFDQFHLLDRIELVPGDFFEAIPVKADLYLLKNVLQQWNDAEALAILRNIRSAMPEGARLAVIERLMPERAGDDPAPGAVHEPADIGGELHGLWPGEQHAEIKRMQEAILGDPAALVHEHAVHQSDLPGGPAEGQDADLRPDGERFTESGS